MSKKIAIIGAGVSGLAAAFRLVQQGYEVEIFEKSRGFSGRAASRSKNGARYDYGANYFKVKSDEVKSLIFDELPDDDLCLIEGDISTFDQNGIVLPGDPQQNSVSKWTYRSGISTLGKLIVKKADLSVHRSTRIGRVGFENGSWHVISDEGRKFEGYAVVLVTIPAPQAIDLIQSSDLDSDIESGLTAELKQSRYHSQFSVMMNFAGTIHLPHDSYALINSDRVHEIAWLSLENRKPGHVPDGESILIAQLSPQWSITNFESPIEQVAEVAISGVGKLVEQALPEPQWVDTQRWKFAHPHTSACYNKVSNLAPPGLYFSGDTFVGKGRVPESIETGFRAAQDINRYLQN